MVSVQFHETNHALMEVVAVGTHLASSTLGATIAPLSLTPKF
jgi:hypothetical protein